MNSLSHGKKNSQEASQGKQLGGTRDQRILQEKDWKFKSFLKKSYLTRWSGGLDDAEAHRSYEKPNNHMDFARYMDALE